jgi:hypothetical protein
LSTKYEEEDVHTIWDVIYIIHNTATDDGILGEGRHPAFQCIFQLLYRFILDILQQCKINKNTEHPDSFHDNALLAKILADAYQKNICLPILLN